jgi:hypothetical protein
VTPAPCSTEEAKRAPRHRPHAGLIADVQRWRPSCIWGAVIISLSALRHARSVRYLTGLSRAPQDFDHRPCGRAPEPQLLTRLTALNSVFNIVKLLPNNVDGAFAMPINEASSGDPCDPVHGARIGAESLRRVKLTITRCCRPRYA